MTRRWLPSMIAAISKGSSRRWNRRTRLPMRPSWRQPCQVTSPSWSICGAAATRTCTQWPKGWGSISAEGPVPRTAPFIYQEATMSRIAPRFASLKLRQKTGLVTFITAGDPSPELTVPLMHALVAGGADVLELGVPFSDPMAEGPVIQRACERALKFNIGLKDVLEYVRQFRETNQQTPVVLMGYANPIERMGTD